MNTKLIYKTLVIIEFKAVVESGKFLSYIFF
jgi:hypothetical protein